MRPSTQRDVHPLPHLVAVDDQRAERRDDEQRQEDVEHAVRDDTI